MLNHRGHLLLGRLVDGPQRDIVESIQRQADDARRVGIAGLEAGDQPGDMNRRPLLEDRVDERDRNGPAQIAHQIEDRAGIGQIVAEAMLERDGHAGQDAEHDPGAAQGLGPEETGEIRLHRLEAVGDQADSEQAIADCRQQQQIHAPLRDGRYRCRQELRHSAHDHDEADLDGRVVAHQPEEHRRQIDRAVKSGAEGEAEEAAGGEGPLAEEGEVDDGLGMGEAAVHRAIPLATQMNPSAEM